MLPLGVRRYLESWGYYPLDKEGFGRNFLSARLGASRERIAGEAEPKRLTAAVSAVPRGRPKERLPSLQELARWLDPNLRQYDPPGRWLPFRQGRAQYTSSGIVLADDDWEAPEGQRGWYAYLFVGRDGYAEFGRKAGFLVRDHAFFAFAPLVAWVQRFVGLGLDLRSLMTEQADYHLVLSIMNTNGAALGVFGHGWREPWDGGPLAGELRTSIERNVQISRPMDVDEQPALTAQWFAERIGNAFGHSDSTLCFNHPDGRDAPPGELPANKWDF